VICLIEGGEKLNNKDKPQNRTLYRESLELSSEQWLELLQDETVFKDEDILLVLELYKCNNSREYASVLADTLGVASHSVLNLQIGRLGKRIIARYPDIKFPTREDGVVRYWHIPFWGEDGEKKGHYYWQLRPELKEAVKMLRSNQKRKIFALHREVQLAQEFDEEQTEKLFEGAKKQIVVNAYERNIKARQICINTYGYKCSICDFDFEEFYGDLGFQFIEVHHLKPLHEIDKEYHVDPINDLRPVCPNCHAMLHRAGISCEELKNKLVQKK
jgi:5-methylcytosine-specific restriction protein A